MSTVEQRQEHKFANDNGGRKFATWQNAGYLERIAQVEAEWASDRRSRGHLTPEDVVRGEFMQGPKTNLDIAKAMSERMRGDMSAYDLNPAEFTQSLGCYNGFHAQQMVKAAKKEKGSTKGVYVYLSGWMVAGTGKSTTFGAMPDQSMQEKTTVVDTIKDIYTSLRQADAVDLSDMFNALDTARAEGRQADVRSIIGKIDNHESNIVPIIADIDAGYGNADACGRLAGAMMDVGACAIQVENQKSDMKECGHQDNKVTDPRDVFHSKMAAIRFEYEARGIRDGIIVARTDSLGAGLTHELPVVQIVGDDAYQYNKWLDLTPVEPGQTLQPYQLLMANEMGKVCSLKRRPNGLNEFKSGTGEQRVVEDCRRALDEGADLLWIETGKPKIDQIGRIVGQIRETHPQAKLTYNNSPSFNWVKHYREEAYKVMKEAGEDVSAYPDPSQFKNFDEFGKVLCSERFDATPLDKIARQMVREFQGQLAEIGVFHNLITLPTYHTTALSMDKLARGYFGDKRMEEYAYGVQLEEIRAGVDTVRHQHESGSDLADLRKKIFEGDRAKTAAGEHNTSHQFDAPTLVTKANAEHAIGKGRPLVLSAL